VRGILCLSEGFPAVIAFLAFLFSDITVQFKLVNVRLDRQIQDLTPTWGRIVVTRQLLLLGWQEMGLKAYSPLVLLFVVVYFRIVRGVVF